MLKAIVNFLWGNSESELSLDEAYKILETKDEVKESFTELSQHESPDEFVCYQKTGLITAAEDDNYIIDDVYKFKSNLKNLAVGSQVSFTIFTSDGELKVSDVVIEDDWFCQRTDEKRSWCQRSLICNISKREGRQIFLTPARIDFDLNDVSAEFIPIVGDWVEVDAKVELDENVSDLCGKILEVEKVRPLRPSLFEGHVKQWFADNEEGVIGHKIFFKGDALAPGYIPIIGDKVVAEIIESDQGNCNRRALKVIAYHQTAKITSSSESNLPKFDIDRKGIFVSDNVTVHAQKLGIKVKFVMEVVNKCERDLTLSVSLPTANSQCTFIKPDVLTGVSIKCGKSICFEGVCATKYVGVTKEFVLFSFGDFNIGRWITVNVILSNVTKNDSKFRKQSFAQTRFGNNNMIKGQKVASGPRFVSRRLPDYPVPQKLLDLAFKDEKKIFTGNVLRAKPCLTVKFQFNIYEDRFHTLLHLEEIAELEAIKTYSQDFACFIRNGEYLMLEIENLAEKRPSLLVGDRIIAKDPYNVNSQEYEGYIHKIEAKHVFLKFASIFHDEYRGEDMSVMAIASRASFRRMHQAIGLAVHNFGPAFLFPQKITTRSPQIEFNLETDRESLINSTHSLNSSSHSSEDNNRTPDNSPSKQTRNSMLLNALKNHVYSEKKSIKNITDEHILEWYNSSLNFYQREAVRNILLGVARPLPYFIYGPPGTGKTVTLVEAILQILRFIPHSRILVGTPSNNAANIIALRLIDSGVLKPGDLIRLVGFRYVAEDLLPTALIPYSATADIAREGTTRQKFHILKNGMKMGCNSAIIGRHRITVGTCTTLGTLLSIGLPKDNFTHVIVDEAGQAKEPEVMIPLSLLDVSSGQIILAGDPRQLGPVILSPAALECGFGETYLDRMLNRYPYIRDMEGFPKTDGYDPRLVTKLVYNYRSLPDILNMSSRMFYNGQLIATISPNDSKEANMLNSLKEMLPRRSDFKIPAVVFHGVIGENSQSSDCPSWFNANEASQIFYYVNELYRLGIKSTDIGIISPYLKQVRLIRALLNEAEFDMPKVGTVEEFQGHECNVILITTVRSNENLLHRDVQFNLGFLSNEKRLNVAITRAQALMIIVGNPVLLCKDPHWRSIIKYCSESGAYCGCSLPNLE